MTDGERMIWAAAFTGYLLKHLDGKHPPDHVMPFPEKWKAWEREQVSLAAEWAYVCVAGLRERHGYLVSHFIPKIGEMVSCMLEKTP